MGNKEITYHLIDTEGLATALAEDAWTEEVKVKGLSESDLYETIGDRSTKQVKAEWASSFFALRECFIKIIDQFKRDPLCSS